MGGYKDEEREKAAADAKTKYEMLGWQAQPDDQAQAGRAR